jgi:hypothetical protein
VCHGRNNTGYTGYTGYTGDHDYDYKYGHGKHGKHGKHDYHDEEEYPGTCNPGARSPRKLLESCGCTTFQHSTHPLHATGKPTTGPENHHMHLFTEHTALCVLAAITQATLATPVTTTMTTSMAMASTASTATTTSTTVRAASDHL